MQLKSYRAIIRAAGAFIGALAALLTPARAADVRVAVQFGLPYLPLMMMEADKLFEAEAKKQGIPDAELKLLKVSGSAAVNDALLSGATELGILGTPGLLIAWDKTRTSLAIKGLANCATHPIVLNTNKPNIKSLSDIGPSDRIAIPAANSPQAILLGMAAEKLYGKDQSQRFSTNLQPLPHPDAMAALLSGTEISAHFTTAPFNVWELENPKIHRVTTSTEIMGEAATIVALSATTKWVDANPKLAEAMFLAMTEAMRSINADPKHAAEVYLKNEPSKMSPEFVEKLLRNPENIFRIEPTGIMAYADFMQRAGQIKVKPDKWEDVFFPYLKGQKGS